MWRSRNATTHIFASSPRCCYATISSGKHFRTKGPPLSLEHVSFQAFLSIKWFLFQLLTCRCPFCLTCRCPFCLTHRRPSQLECRRALFTLRSKIREGKDLKLISFLPSVRAKTACPPSMARHCEGNWQYVLLFSSHFAYLKSYSRMPPMVSPYPSSPTGSILWPRVVPTRPALFHHSLLRDARDNPIDLFVS